GFKLSLQGFMLSLNTERNSVLLPNIFVCKVLANLSRSSCKGMICRNPPDCIGINIRRN
ncbi:hypothetical protein A2U01_0071749, partial [Trifolium medium]|nr:hypothetical protein [Trifolium medium]